MFVDITQADIDAALLDSDRVKTYQHIRYNPLAKALERKFGDGNVVVTEERVHISTRAFEGVFPLCMAAKNYLKLFRYSAHAKPVERLAAYHDHEYR